MQFNFSNSGHGKGVKNKSCVTISFIKAVFRPATGQMTDRSEAAKEDNYEDFEEEDVDWENEGT